MNSRTIDTLRDLGLDISEVQYKYPLSDPTDYQPTKFIIKGEFQDESDLQLLMDEIHILRAVRHNRHPAAKNLFEQLKTITGITK